MYHKCASYFGNGSLSYLSEESVHGTWKMNLRLFEYRLCIVVSAMWLSTSRALLEGNESSPATSRIAIERWPTLRYRKMEQLPERDEGGAEGGGGGGAARSEETQECADRSIDDFPEDWFTDEQRRNGAVALHAFLAFYCFLLTAFVCHDYLLPSVDRICLAMSISPDVAGATFLAMASSFPEMFVNLIGTFLTESDLGAGTVVGSAVFDTFATPACGALVAVHAIPLEWRILSRDCLVYVISVGTLVIIMWDQRIRWYEAMILLLVLFSYLVLLFCGKAVTRCCGIVARVNSSSTAELTVATPSADKPELAAVEQGSSGKKGTTVDPAEKERTMFDYLFSWPGERSFPAKCWYLLGWPLKFLLFATIPDARVKRFRSWYPITFLVCVIWIGIASYLVSWMMTVVGDTIGIPDSIMGLTFLAAGGNMPEMASIVILAKQGNGDTGMSNTLGANILDILLCLGLPWTIKTLMTGRDVEIVSGALSYSVLSIVGCIVVLYAVIAFFRFRLNRKVGLICLLLYAIFLCFAILVESNVFFYVNPPMCEQRTLRG